jgi:hypothetical protein
MFLLETNVVALTNRDGNPTRSMNVALLVTVPHFRCVHFGHRRAHRIFWKKNYSSFSMKCDRCDSVKIRNMTDFEALLIVRGGFIGHRTVSSDPEECSWASTIITLNQHFHTWNTSIFLAVLFNDHFHYPYLLPLSSPGAFRPLRRRRSCLFSSQ